MILALCLFLVMYVLLLLLPEKKYIIALTTAAIFVLLGILPIQQVFGAIDWNIILMLTGTMMVVELFIESQMPALMAEKLLMKMPNVKMAIVVIAAFSGIISAFVDNVATVLIVAPIGLAIAKKIKTNPVPVLIAIAVSSNLQGAATLVGDTTSILLGSYANMSFNDFFYFLGKPGITVSVEVGAVLTLPVLYFLFRKENGKVSGDITVKVTDYVPSFLMLGIIVGLIVASQFPHKPEITNGLICVGIACFGLVYRAIREKSMKPITKTLKAVDYKTLLLLSGLFIVIAGVTEAGVIDAIADLFIKFGGNSLFVMYTLIVFASVFFSAFVDNIPYVATMLPVVQGIAMSMGVEPYVLYFGLLIGATLGGNLTPIGASANVTAIGILQKEGYKVDTKEYLKIGVPMTIVAVVVGYLVNWLIWGL